RDATRFRADSHVAALPGSPTRIGQPCRHGTSRRYRLEPSHVIGDGDRRRRARDCRGHCCKQLMAGTRNVETLIRLFDRIDPTFFNPHPLTPAEARRIASYEGQDVYLWT